jgi:hypothetical protein
MNYSTYNSLLTKRKTWLIASIGRCGYVEYKEVQIRCYKGLFSYIITDGYKYLTIERTGFKGLKEALNHAKQEMV